MKIENMLAEDAYNMLKQRQPKLAKVVTELVKKGQSPYQVQKHVLKTTGQPFLAALVGMAAEYIKSAKCQ
jgi:hypothetical protein